MYIKDILRQLSIKDLQLGSGMELIEFFTKETFVRDDEDLEYQLIECLQLIPHEERMIIKENLDRLIGGSNNVLLQQIANICSQYFHNNPTEVPDDLTEETSGFVESVEPINSFLPISDEEKAAGIKSILISRRMEVIKQIPNTDILWFLAYCPPGKHSGEAKVAAIKCIFHSNCLEIIKLIPKSDITWFLSYCPSGKNSDATKAAAIKSILSCRCPEIINQISLTDIIWFISYCPPGKHSDEAKFTAIKNILNSHCLKVIELISKTDFIWFLSYCPTAHNTDAARAAAIKSILKCRCVGIIRQIPTDDIIWYITCYPENSNEKTALAIEEVLKSRCTPLIHSLYDIKISDINALQWYFHPNRHEETVNKRILYLLSHKLIYENDKVYLLAFALNYDPKHPLLQNPDRKMQSLINKIMVIIKFSPEYKERNSIFNYTVGVDLPHPFELQQNSRGTVIISSEESIQWKAAISARLLTAGISCTKIQNIEAYLLSFNPCKYLPWFKIYSRDIANVPILDSTVTIDNNNNNNMSTDQIADDNAFSTDPSVWLAVFADELGPQVEPSVLPIQYDPNTNFLAPDHHKRNEPDGEEPQIFSEERRRRGNDC